MVTRWFSLAPFVFLLGSSLAEESYDHDHQEPESVGIGISRLFFFLVLGIGGLCCYYYWEQINAWIVARQLQDAVDVSKCAAGIVIPLLVYGVQQERMMTKPYDGEYFQAVFLLVLTNRLLALAYAATMGWYSGEDFRTSAPFYKFIGIAATNVISASCQYEALKYLSFPTQTLGKCAKMVPVMIWSTFISGKRYGLRDYLIAVGITLGATLFLTGGDFSSSSKKEGVDEMWGFIFIFGYLFCDGLTSTLQEKLFHGVSMGHNTKLFMTNLASCGLSFLGLVLMPKEGDALIPALTFVKTHPSILTDMTILAIAQTTAQNFIVLTLSRYTALLFATIMTTRQFISVLLSCLWFAHPLTLVQWLGTITVFGSLYYKSLAAHKANIAKKKRNTEMTTEEPGELPPPPGGEVELQHSPLIAKDPAST